MQPAPKQQLSTMGVENIFPYTGFTEENLREYYENPPAGMKIIYLLYSFLKCSFMDYLANYKSIFYKF